MKKGQTCTEHRVLVDPAPPDPQTGSAVSCTGSGMGQDECAVTACVARPSPLISLAVALPVPGTRLQMGGAKAPLGNRISGRLLVRQYAGQYTGPS